MPNRVLVHYANVASSIVVQAIFVTSATLLHDLPASVSSLYTEAPP